MDTQNFLQDVHLKVLLSDIRLRPHPGERLFPPFPKGFPNFHGPFLLPIAGNIQHFQKFLYIECEQC